MRNLHRAKKQKSGSPRFLRVTGFYIYKKQTHELHFILSNSSDAQKKKREKKAKSEKATWLPRHHKKKGERKEKEAEEGR